MPPGCEVKPVDTVIVGLVLISAVSFTGYRAYCLLVKKEINTCCNYCPDKNHCKDRLDYSRSMT